MKTVEIMDTTLRDGEQTSGVAFSAQEKLDIARLLLNKLHVNRIEIASARVSDGEFEAVTKICEWAERHNYIDKIEVLGFLDGTTSLEWLQRTGCKTINLRTKGSMNHLTNQLRNTAEQDINDIKQFLTDANTRNITDDIYL